MYRIEVRYQKGKEQTMRQVKRYIGILLFLAMCICTNLNDRCMIKAADVASEQITDAKKGILEIQSGIVAKNGEFYAIKNSSGFLVSNSSDGVYVVTTNKTVTLTAKQKKKFCKKNKIKIDDTGSELETKIYAIVEGDVFTELTIRANSEEEDFCLMEAEDVFQEKNSLPLENQKDVLIGDAVYALGVAKQDEQKLSFLEENVEIHAGTIVDNGAKIGKEKYLQHSAIIDSDNNGGVLLSADGYVIGMNNSSLTVKEKDSYYALPITRLISILDNYGIEYMNRQLNEAYESFEKTYHRCEAEYNSGNYKSVSMAELGNLLEDYAEIMKKTEMHSIEDLRLMQNKLEDAKALLQIKMTKIRIVQIIVGVAIGIFFVWMLVLLISITKEKSNKAGEKAAQNKSVNNKNMQRVGNSVSESEVKVQKIQISQENVNGFSNQSNVRKPNCQVSRIQSRNDEDKCTAMLQGDEDERTMILQTAFYAGEYCLKRTKNGECISIDQIETIIGKSREQADYVIADNHAISRVHARLLWDNGNYYLQDMNSANGTVVNGKRIDGKGVKLELHDTIVLADEQFEFMLQGGTGSGY